MSENSPSDLRQDRRQWLKTSATVLGASLLPLSAARPAEAEQAQTPSPAAPAKSAETKSTGHFFTPNEHTLVEELSETIIPADSHSGGAKAAKVADYIEQTLRKSTDESKKALWRECLPLIDSMSQHYNGKSFVNASPEERISVLTVLSVNASGPATTRRGWRPSGNYTAGHRPRRHDADEPTVTASSFNALRRANTCALGGSGILSGTGSVLMSAGAGEDIGKPNIR